MPINILMPALSPTMEKGNLAKWLKKEGEKIKPGDVIAEIETDKATMEVEAVDEGTLAKIVVPEGTADVPVNQLIAVLAGEGEDAKAAASAAGSAPAPKPVAAAPAPPAAAPKAEAPKTEAPKAAAAQSPAAAPAPAAAAKTNGQGGRIFSSPLARRLAKEAGIDLSRIAEAVVKGAEVGGHAGQHHCHRRLDPLPQRSVGIATVGRGQIPCDLLGRGPGHRDVREEASLVAG